MKKLLFILVLCLITVAGFGQISSVKVLSPSASLYSKVEFEVKLKGSWENPHDQQQATLDMHIVAPDGAKLVLPCYFESGDAGKTSVWKARFAPREVGKYDYKFVYTEKGQQKSVSSNEKLNVGKSTTKGFLSCENNWILRFDNGAPFRGIAENICWESRASDDSKFFKNLHEAHDKYNYDYLLPQFSQNGGNFIRVWMCSWNFPIDRKKDFNNNRYTASEEYFNPSAVARLDHMVDLCEKLDIYVMLCMGQGDVSADRNFFVSPEAKAKYKNRARYIIARWGYSPSIAMWEFFNEIDNIQFRNRENPIPAADIVNWHDEMSRYFKQVDPYKHILTTSISHRDLDGLNSVENIDINQKHIYNHTSSIPSEILKYEAKYGKPYVIGEFGYEWDWQKNFDDFADGMDCDFKRGLWYGIFTPTPLTPLSWWWEYFENRGMVSYFKGPRMISDKMLADGKGSFEPMGSSASGLQTFVVKCGDVIYAYVFNDISDVQRYNLTINHVSPNQYTAQKFDTNNQTFSDLGAVSAKTGLVLGGVTLKKGEEAVYILTPKK